MNWTDLNEIHRRAISKEMTVKEASDFISMSWWLIKFHTYRKDLYAGPNYNEEHTRLLDLSVAIYQRAHDTE